MHRVPAAARSLEYRYLIIVILSLIMHSNKKETMHAVATVDHLLPLSVATVIN